ncbi:hypothetical protein HG537_0G02300 [Torulaspora globosa]|uniref:PNPLA domain-containing protein n=1 Tax=Torulaspora globosa TaxID=48254 RepID=A0A7H9HZG4_9SACH|nr:hypothetical protein HG537_0G02300 [Torulaspora sp. CBS 2947]
MNGNLALQNRPLAVTQHLIEKYYEHIHNASSADRNKGRRRICDGGDMVERRYELNRQGGKYLTDVQHKNGISFGSYDLDYEEAVSTDEELNDEVCEDDELEEEERVSFFPKCKAFIYSLFVGDYEKDLLIERILATKQHAMSYEEWSYAGLRLDELTDKTKWKQKVESNLYDYRLIRELTTKLREKRLAEDYSGLLYTIRTSWVRNLGNMGNVNLYRHSHVGTKFLTDEYLNESRLAIDALLHQSELDDGYLLGILQQTRRNIGRTALVLSGGGTFGLFHIGVLSTLFELDLLPRVISGSSAGAIVASILSVHHKDEIPQLLERVLDTDFNIFKDDKQKSESENFLIKISRFLKNGTWFDNKNLVNTMVSFLGDLTFREAYNRTGKILNITVSPASLFEQPRLLNNLTAPNVLIWSAVCASCSLPGIFPSSPLYEKDPQTGEKREWSGSASVKFVDGSVDNDLPISRLSEMFNVDHIIACQVNVHVFPFLKLSLSCVGGDIEDEFSARLKQNLTNVYNFMANEAIHILELACELGVAKNALTKMRSVLSQQYSGDITILPDMKMLFRLNELLANPSREFLLRETTNGARATWPKVSIIQNHCGQEFALDKAITYLKGRIIGSSSIRNPLQFVDMPVGLIKTQGPKDNVGDKEEGNIITSLDDNLFESESINSLLLLREDAADNKRDYTGKFSLPLYETPRSVRHQRRKSETNARSRQSSNSVSFPVSSSSSRIQRGTGKAFANPPRLSKKLSTGHIYLQMPPRGEQKRLSDRRDSFVAIDSSDIPPQSAPGGVDLRTKNSSPRSVRQRSKRNRKKRSNILSTAGSEEEETSGIFAGSPNDQRDRKTYAFRSRQNSMNDNSLKRLSASSGGPSPKSQKALTLKDDATTKIELLDKSPTNTATPSSEDL